MAARLIVAVGVAGALLALPCSAVAGTFTWTSGPVRATLSWKGDRTEGRNIRIAIDRFDRRVLDEKLRADACESQTVKGPCPRLPGGDPMRVRNLDADSEPEVLIAAETGGHLCCSIALVYRWTGSAYVQSQHNFREGGFVFRDFDDDGTRDFGSLDARFLSLYSGIRESVLPLQVFVFDRGKFIDATHTLSSLIREGARVERDEFERRAGRPRRSGVRPALAAYVAYLYRLDRFAKAERILDDALARGLLARYRRSDVGPFGRKFIHDLKRHLRRWGYRSRGAPP